MTTRIDEMIADAKEKGLDDLVSVLEEKRDALGADPSEEDVANAIREALLQHMSGLIPETDPEFMENTINGIKEIFTEQKWRFHLENVRPDVAVFELGFNIEVNEKPTSISVKVYVEEKPQSCRIYATLPFTAEDTYAYPLCRTLARINYNKRFGAFTYDERDGELGYDYCYPVGNGIHKDDFLKAFRAVLHSAADDDDIPEIKKCATGRFKNREKNEILEQINDLIEDLTGE